MSWQRTDRVPKDATPERVWIGADPNGLGFEAAVAAWSGSTPPTLQALRALHATRLGNRAVPLCVIVHDTRGRAWIFGPSTAGLPLGPIPSTQAARLIQAALDEPNSGAARARILRSREALDSAEIAGLDSQGLFATRELTYGVPRRRGWTSACEHARNTLSNSPRGAQLIRALGFESRSIPGNAQLLTVGTEPPRAVAILLRDEETFDAESPRFTKSAVYHGLEVGRQNNVPWLVIARGPQLRLYPTSPDVGVSRRGATQTYFGLDLALLDDEHAGYLDLVFSGPGLSPGGSVDQLLAASRNFAVALGVRLRDRIYEGVVDPLSTAVARALANHRPFSEPDLAQAYRVTLRILFRLLFQAYAEDNGLLPLHQNERYTKESLKELARDLAEHPDRPHDAESTSLWDGLHQVWRVIDTGDQAWGVPAYNGGLFGTDPTLHPDGALTGAIKLHNDALGPALAALLVDTTDDGTRGPVDFRALDVRDFGTIYEGLLESGLSVATEDLTVDSSGAWRPAATGDRVDAAKGSPYFHTKSGGRKATGSYFTKPFAVEHLLERALDPAMDAHLQRVEAIVERGDQVGAARAFFDFRVADIAMGSGHFLVAAISHIETKFGEFLERRPIPGVETELIELREAALSALGQVGVDAEIDRSALLGRQVARRCIYGLDINEIAVELARLAVWVRTFVPGLPMSSLDHQLVCANSLTGIGTVQEASLALDPGARPDELTFSGAAIEGALADARRVLEDAAALKEATRQETQAAQEAVKQALAAAEPTRRLFDAAVAVRLGLLSPPADFDAAVIGDRAREPRIRSAIAGLSPAHFPLLFPEVFLRDPSGFDVVIGNPPWEKVKVEEHQWWGLRFPGLRSLATAQRDTRIRNLKAERPDLMAEYEAEVETTSAFRRVLGAGPYPGIGAGDIDLYKAFCWRNWQLLREGGRFGVLLPRGGLSGSGTERWRRAILADGAFEDVCFLANTNRWAFDQVDGRYTFAMTVVSKGTPGVVRFTGPFHSQPEYRAGRDDSTEVSAKDFASWSATAAFPLLPDPESSAVFLQLRLHPSLGAHPDFTVRPVAELHSSANRPLYNFESTGGPGEVPVLAGASFHLWNPDHGRPYAWAVKDEVHRYLRNKLDRQRGLQSSAFRGWPDNRGLPASRARVAFRDVTRSTDTRTVIVCLIPPESLLTEQAPFLLALRASERDEAYLVGVMSSLVFDWYARRYVELHLKYNLLNVFPVPRQDGRWSEQVVSLAGRLAARDERFSQWAGGVGVPVGSVTLNEQPELEAEMDALAAHLYGLRREHLMHLFKTFHRGWDYTDRLERVLGHYDRWVSA